jgi:hypothetical protein
MCLISISRRGTTIPKAYLQEGFFNNPDGAGFTYSKEGQLFIEKGFFTFDEFYARYSLVSGFDLTSVVHFRRATNKVNTAENCHPFSIDENHAFIHNGVIEKFHVEGSPISDTRFFVNDVIKPLFKDGPNVWKKKYGKALLEAAIGLNNKAVILSNEGEFVIYKDYLGHWDRGIWYSNYSYLGPIKRVYASTFRQPVYPNHLQPSCF